MVDVAPLAANSGSSTPPRWNQLYFDDWVEGEGLELIRGHKTPNLFTIPLKYWPRVGGQAVQIQLDGTGELNAAYVCEIAPRQSLNPMRHLYEEVFYVLSGDGATSIWYEEGHKQTVEWTAGSLMAIPLNTYYQHQNLSGSEPARYVAVTTAPVMMNLLRDEDFIFNNPVKFPWRFSGEDGYFSQPAYEETFTVWEEPEPLTMTNFVADIHGTPFHKSVRGNRMKSVSYELGEGILGVHVLQLPGGCFTNVHRHGPGAHVLWLKGEGYSLLWPDGGEKLQEFWEPGTMMVPPSWWWHQHAVVSSAPGEHIALKLGSKRYKVNRLGNGTMRSTRTGGSTLIFDDFPPELKEEVERLFIAECEKRGTPVDLEPIYGA